MSKHTPTHWDLVTRLREGRTNGSNLQWTVRSEHVEAADEIDRLRAVNADLMDALVKAANWFREYEAIHIAKGGAADAKAARNRERAEQIEAAIAAAEVSDNAPR